MTPMYRHSQVIAYWEKRLGNDSIWDVMTALRGPDDGDTDLKRALTAPLRSFFIPEDLIGGNRSDRVVFHDKSDNFKRYLWYQTKEIRRFMLYPTTPLAIFDYRGRQCGEVERPSTHYLGHIQPAMEMAAQVLELNLYRPAPEWPSDADLEGSPR